MGRVGLACAAGALLLAAAPVSSAKTVLTVMDWKLNETPATQKWFAEVKQKFEQAHPDVEVNYVTAAWGDAYRDKIVTGVVAGSAPDVVSLSIVWARDLWEAGALLDLGPYMKTTPSMAPTQFIPATQQYNQKGGHIYGIPNAMDESLLMYNIDKFQDVGVSADPNGIATWDDFRAAAKKLTKTGADGKISQFALSMGMSLESFNSWLVADDGSFYNADLTQSAFASAQGVETGTFLDQLRREQVLGGDFAARTAAIGYGGNWSPYILAGDNPDLNFNLTSFPAGPSSNHRGTTAWGNMNAITASSAHPELAWQFITMYDSLQSSERLFEALHYVESPRLDFWQSASWKAHVNDYIWMKQIPYIASVGGTYPFVRYADLAGKVWPLMNQALQGQKPVKSAFDDAASLYDQILAAAPGKK